MWTSLADQIKVGGVSMAVSLGYADAIFERIHVMTPMVSTSERDEVFSHGPLWSWRIPPACSSVRLGGQAALWCQEKVCDDVWWRFIMGKQKLCKTHITQFFVVLLMIFTIHISKMFRPRLVDICSFTGHLKNQESCLGLGRFFLDASSCGMFMTYLVDPNYLMLSAAAVQVL